MAAGDGVCIWFTGRSGAGKTTVTDSLLSLLQDAGRTVTVLDVVPEFAKLPGERTSEGKLMRKAVVAREVVRHGGVAICVTVGARIEVRREARAMVGPGSFVEVHLDVPAEVSEARRNNRSGKRSLVKRLRRGLRRLRSSMRRGAQTTENWRETADLTLDAVNGTPEAHARAIFDLLLDRGLVVNSKISPG